MTSLRRRIGAVCAAGGMLAGVLLAAGQVPAAASQASPAGTARSAGAASPATRPSVSVKVTTPGLKPVTGYRWVYYKIAKFSHANVDATISGVHGGEVVKLRARRWPFKKAASVLATAVVPSGLSKITFNNTVTPTLATRYTVAVYAGKKAKTPLTTSAAHTVYVVLRGHNAQPKPCSGTECHLTFKLYVPTPPSALRREMGKRMYAYLGVTRSKTGTPTPPKVMRLNAGHAKVARARKVSAREFEVTVKYTFWIGTEHYYWAAHVCQKSTESKDGVNLPGSHGCGAKTIKTSTYFIG
jgi:hypothetical protein